MEFQVRQALANHQESLQGLYSGNPKRATARPTTELLLATSIALPPEDPFKMVVDRPFVAAIRDRNTGALLFVVAIVDPR